MVMLEAVGASVGRVHQTGWLATAVASVLLHTSALAADLPVNAPPPSLGYLDWSGAYVGVHVGYGGGMKDWGLGGKADFVAEGALGGGQIGINKQLASFVYGIELDGSWADINGSRPSAFSFGTLSVDNIWRSKIDGLATFTGRAGVAAGRWFVYAKAGFVAAHEEHFLGLSVRVVRIATSVTREAANEVRFGQMAGFGAEYALSGPWSLKGEYNYLHLGDRQLFFRDLDVGAGRRLSIEQNIHLVKFGANYRFGGLSTDPSFKPVPPAKGTDWTGLYVGAQAGYGFGQGFWQRYGFAFPGTEYSTDGWLAGVTGGVNAQSGVFVFGVEGEWMWSGINQSKPYGRGGIVSFADRVDWLAMATARAGFVAFDRLLLYGKSGVAIASEHHSELDAGPPTFSYSGHSIHTGVVAGIGGEYALGGNWSVKAEYDFVRMLGQGTMIFASTNTIGNQYLDKMPLDLHLVKFGLNYHINAAQTVLAKY